MDPNAGWFGKLQQNTVVGVLRRLDRLPRHIGIVMDGNRRYARQHGADRKAGHTSGFETMNQILAVAYSAGIAEVTVYAFSIENFHRTPEEVDDLMDIARTRLRELIANAGVAQQYGVRVNVLGRLLLLPKDIQALAQEIMASTAGNTQATLNLCMPYTSRDDMAQAMVAAASNAARKTVNYPQKIASETERTAINATINGEESVSRENSEAIDSLSASQKTPVSNHASLSEPMVSDETQLRATEQKLINNDAVPKITENDILDRMHTQACLPLDILIRTSDTYRLSDFLLWEVTDHTYIDFVSELWPAYTPIHLLRTVMHWRIRGFAR